jgi:transposase
MSYTIHSISNEKIEKLEQENRALKDELNWLKKQIFGSKSEKLRPTNDEQADLFAATAKDIKDSTQKECISYTRNKRKNKPTRQSFPEHLERREIIVDLPEDSKECECGNKQTFVRYETTEELEYKPAEFYVNQIKRTLYSCKKCPENGVSIPFLPDRPIDKGKPGVGLLTHLFISKFVDHLPFYRQQKIFDRLGVYIAESTMSDWMEKIFELLTPLYNELKEVVLSCEHINADETTIKVKVPEKKYKTHTGYYFGYIGDKKYLCFDYCINRNKDGPNSFLKNFEGYSIQADAYGGYNDLFVDSDIKRAGCIAHVRRKFKDAHETGYSNALEVLELIKKLYAVESEIKKNQLDNNQIENIRITKSIPVLNELKKWMDTNGLSILPKSALGKAVTYFQNQWKTLTTYCENGNIDIDNNIIERAIRPIALGRKNYLFAGSHKGAKRAALLYSLLGTCALNDVEPSKYLRYILSNIKSWPSLKLRELLPDRVKI